MRESLLELALQSAELVVVTAGAVLVSALGVYLEGMGLQTVTAGTTDTGLWLVAMGLVALYFGLYLVGYSELLPRLRTFSAALRDR